jgi:hypothetical protein
MFLKQIISLRQIAAHLAVLPSLGETKPPSKETRGPGTSCPDWPDQRLSWEANSYQANQEIPLLLREPVDHKMPPVVPILSQINLLHILPHYFCTVKQKAWTDTINVQYIVG